MDISAKITGIKYKPFLCAKLKTYPFKDLQKALSKNAIFLLDVDKENKVAISWWVSAKRTRSYPYARVYDTGPHPKIWTHSIGGFKDFLKRIQSAKMKQKDICPSQREPIQVNLRPI